MLHLFRRGLLSRTSNLADPQSRTPSQIKADYAKAVLRDNRGVAFVVSPASGVLEPFSQLAVSVEAFSDMWGSYTENLICKVRERFLHQEFLFYFACRLSSGFSRTQTTLKVWRNLCCTSWPAQVEKLPPNFIFWNINLNFFATFSAFKAALWYWARSPEWWFEQSIWLMNLGILFSRLWSVVTWRLSPLDSSFGASDQQSVLCNPINRAQCTYRKQKEFASVFLVWLVANCTTAPYKPLHDALKHEKKY